MLRGLRAPARQMILNIMSLHLSYISINLYFEPFFTIIDTSHPDFIGSGSLTQISTAPEDQASMGSQKGPTPSLLMSQAPQTQQRPPQPVRAFLHYALIFSRFPVFYWWITRVLVA